MSAARRTSSGKCRGRAGSRGEGRRGLTLFEVVISIGIIVVLMAAMLVFFWQFLEAREIAAAASDKSQVARQVLERIADELRSCVGMDEIGFPMEHGQRLVGERRSISFLTLGMPGRHQYAFYDATEQKLLPAAQHDLRQIGYYLWIDKENTDEDGNPLIGGIVRTDKKTLNQQLVEEDDAEQFRQDLWSHELGYLEFRYFDGVEWDTKWDVTEGNSLPQLIQVTVGFVPATLAEVEDKDLDEYPVADFPLGDDKPHADRYSTIVRIPAADRLFGSRVQRVGKQFSEQLGVTGAGE